MKTTTALAALAILAGAMTGHATVAVTGTNFNLAAGSEAAALLTDAAGNPLSGSWAVGAFAPGTNFAGSATTLLSAFDQNGSSGQFVATAPGAFGSQVSDAATSLAGGQDDFKNTPIYLVIVNDLVFQNATDLIVYQSSVLWPEEVEVVGAAATVRTTDSTLLRGTLTTVQGAIGPFAQFNGTASGVTFIPEPSTTLLAGLASLALLRRRRS